MQIGVYVQVFELWDRWLWQVISKLVVTFELDIGLRPVADTLYHSLTSPYVGSMYFGFDFLFGATQFSTINAKWREISSLSKFWCGLRSANSNIVAYYPVYQHNVYIINHLDVFISPKLVSMMHIYLPFISSWTTRNSFACLLWSLCVFVGIFVIWCAHYNEMR